MQNIPVTLLPLWAQIILLAVVAIAIIQQFRHSTALGEFNIVKQANERLRGELTTALQRVATLEARTDLQPVIESFHSFATGLEAWKDEARGHYTGALQRLEQMRDENLEGVKATQLILIQIADKLTKEK